MKDLTKQNLEVREFSLKQIVENLDKIPSNGKFGDERQKLTPQQKKRLMELVGKYNEYGKALQCETALMESAKAMDEISTLAEGYALTESEEWMQGRVVERDFKQFKQVCKEYKKLTQECFGNLQQMAALYEDGGHILGRYYEINGLEEIASLKNVPQVNTDSQQDPMDAPTEESLNS